MAIFAFTLSMPNVGSWNGQWSGEQKLYVKCRTLTKERLEESQLKEGNYYYNFGDGWSANVNVRQVDSKEKNSLMKRSDGFAGYEWMINSIIEHGEIISE